MGQPTDRKCHILIATLAGLCDPLENWLFGLVSQPVIIEKLVQPNAGFIEHARMQQANSFLAGPCEWGLLIDADTGPLISCSAFVEGAIAAGAKVVTGITPLHGRGDSPGVYSNLTVTAPNGKDLDRMAWHKLPWGTKNRYQQVAGAGLSFTLLHRSVVEKLVNDAEKRGIEEEYPFRARYERGLMKEGEDRMFFRRVREAGFEVVADMEARCAHDKHFCLTPLHALYDLPFYSPGEAPHPAAPGNQTVSPEPPVPMIETPSGLVIA